MRDGSTKTTNIHELACDAERASTRELKEGDVVIAAWRCKEQKTFAGFAHLWRIRDNLAVNICSEDSIQNELIKREFDGQTFGVPIEMLVSAYSNHKKLKRLTRRQVESLGMKFYLNGVI